MPRPITAPLADDARTTCPRCGADVWSYTTPIGERIALDDVVGEYVVDGLGKVYRLPTNDGYRAHECGRLASLEVSADEFLWI